jgi:hypothetical protein
VEDGDSITLPDPLDPETIIFPNDIIWPVWGSITNVWEYTLLCPATMNINSDIA